MCKNTLCAKPAQAEREAREDEKNVGHLRQRQKKAIQMLTLLRILPTHTKAPVMKAVDDAKGNRHEGQNGIGGRMTP